MSLRKKIVIAVIAVLVLVGLGSFIKFQSDGNEGAKAIKITVIDEVNDKTVFDKVIHTDAVSLKAVLEETTELKVTFEDGPYGTYMTSILGLKGDMSKGPYLLYESENNEACIAQGMCPALDTLNVQNEDAFTFLYTNDIAY